MKTIKARVREGNNYGGAFGGAIVEVEEDELARVPWCLERVDPAAPAPTRAVPPIGGTAYPSPPTKDEILAAGYPEPGAERIFVREGFYGAHGIEPYGPNQMTEALELELEQLLPAIAPAPIVGPGPTPEELEERAEGKKEQLEHPTPPTPETPAPARGRGKRSS